MLIRGPACYSVRLGAPTDGEGASYLPSPYALFTRIQNMRVVPFDLRSFGQLAASSFGSVATLLPILHVNGDVSGVFDALGKLLGHLGGAR